jgi:hypothetical protein
MREVEAKPIWGDERAFLVYMISQNVLRTKRGCSFRQGETSNESRSSKGGTSDIGPVNHRPEEELVLPVHFVLFHTLFSFTVMSRIFLTTSGPASIQIAGTEKCGVGTNLQSEVEKMRASVVWYNPRSPFIINLQGMTTWVFQRKTWMSC